MNLFFSAGLFGDVSAHALQEANGKAERAVPETVLGAARRRPDVTSVGCAAWR